MPNLHEVARTYLEGLRKAQAGQYGWMVDTPDTAKYPPFLVQNGRAGFCMAGKQLVGVWSSGGNRLPRIITLARAVGAEWLSCYDAGLVRLYEECGCVVTGRRPFNAELAPPNWPGTCFPDYVTMRV